MSAVVLAFFLLSSPPATAGEASPAKLAKKCDKGQASACLELARVWEDEAETACEAGAVPACTGLAQAQLTGLGVGDADRAWRAYEAACFGGIELACQRMGTIKTLRDEPGLPIAPLTVLVSPAGLEVLGVEAAVFSEYANADGEIALPCSVDSGCSRAAHFDWDGLSTILAHIHRADPGRTQAVLRASGVSFDAQLEAARRIAGEDGDQFPSVVIPEASP